MLQDILLTPEEIALKQEVHAFIKREVSSDLIARRLPSSTPRGR
jgi:hypothetical protein